MGTGGTTGGLARSPRARALAGLGLVAGLVAAVVLSRGGTAATPDDLAVPADPGPSATPAATDRLLDVNRLDIDGFAEARLGVEPEAADHPDGVEVWYPTSEEDGCTLLTSSVSRADITVTGWEVDGVVASVAVTATGGTTPVRSTFGVDFGDPLDTVMLLPGARLVEEVVPAAATGAVSAVVVTVAGTEVVASDLGGDAGVTYIELRQPSARDCRAEEYWWASGDIGDDGIPALEATGRGPVRPGQPDTELPGLGLELASGTGASISGCETWWSNGSGGTGTRGLGEVYTREGLVVGVTVYDGPAGEGFAIGDDTDALLRAYPDLAVDGVEAGLLPPFPATLADGRRLGVDLMEELTMPWLVDAPLPTGRQTVTQLTMFWSPCQV